MAVVPSKSRRSPSYSIIGRPGYGIRSAASGPDAASGAGAAEVMFGKGSQLLSGGPLAVVGAEAATLDGIDPFCVMTRP